jgi:hypothetical protein
MAEQVIGGFYEGLKKYTSFEEAEAVAGYHILRPSSEYPVGYGLTYLRWLKDHERPLSQTQYTFPSLANTSIGVEVGPSYYYPEGDKTVMSGKPMTVGGKAGWMLEDTDIAWVFVFECGSVDDMKVWCQVTAVKEVGREAFDHFVSTLQ